MALMHTVMFRDDGAVIEVEVDNLETLLEFCKHGNEHKLIKVVCHTQKKIGIINVAGALMIKDQYYDINPASAFCAIRKWNSPHTDKRLDAHRRLIQNTKRVSSSLLYSAPTETTLDRIERPLLYFDGLLFCLAWADYKKTVKGINACLRRHAASQVDPSLWPPSQQYLGWRVVPFETVCLSGLNLHKDPRLVLVDGNAHIRPDYLKETVALHRAISDAKTVMARMVPVLLQDTRILKAALSGIRQLLAAGEVFLVAERQTISNGKMPECVHNLLYTLPLTQDKKPRIIDQQRLLLARALHDLNMTVPKDTVIQPKDTQQINATIKWANQNKPSPVSCKAMKQLAHVKTQESVCPYARRKFCHGGCTILDNSQW